MSYVLRIIGTAAGVPTEHDGQYVVAFRAARMNARGQYEPGGILRTSARPSDAQRFKTQAEAFMLYAQANGRRPDGRPNKPLSSYTVEISPLDGEEHPT